VKNNQPPLKSLHALVASKIAILEKLSTELLLKTLAPGAKDGLKTRSDGTILDGPHRVQVLRMRNIDVDALPREVILKENPGSRTRTRCLANSIKSMARGRANSG
jgi:hypothetical protein